MKLKVAFILPAFPKLSETFILHQISGLIDAGHEVHIYPASRPNEVKMHKQVSIYELLKRTYYVPSKPKSDVLSVLKLVYLLMKNIRRLPSGLLNRILDDGIPSKEKVLELYQMTPFLKYNNYQIVHAHFGPSGKRAVKARSFGLLSGELVTSFYGFDLSVKNYANETYYKLLSDNCRHYITISKFLKNSAMACGIPGDRISIIPIGVLMSDTGREAQICKPAEKTTFLTVARLVEKKGIEYSLAAFKLLSDKYENVRYNIVGEGRLRIELEKLIVIFGLSEKVTLHGEKTSEEIVEFYKESDVFILSSITARNGDSEGQALVLQEAQCFELPIISSRHEAIAEGVIEGKTAFLVKERDVMAIEKAMGILIQDHSLRRTMGIAGREFVANNFDQDQLNHKLITFYISIVPEQKG